MGQMYMCEGVITLINSVIDLWSIDSVLPISVGTTVYTDSTSV